MTILEFLASLGNVALTGLVLVLAVVVAMQVASRLLLDRIEVRTFVGPEKNQTVEGLSEIVRSELVRLTEEGGGASLFVVNGPDNPIQLPQDIQSPQLDLLTQIMALLPSRGTVVTGRVQPEGGLGLGLSVTLQGGLNRNRASTTIWEADLRLKPSSPLDDRPKTEDKPSTTERYQRLALAAAAWIAYQLANRASARTRIGLLTQDWTSYALFVVGVRMQTVGEDSDRVRTVFQEALSRDPRNRGALFQMGLLHSLDHSNWQAAQYFEACRIEVERAYGPGDDGWRFDRLWYRATINSGIARVNEVAVVAGSGRRTAPGVAFPDADTEDLRTVARERLRSTALEAQSAIAALVGHEPPIRHGQYAELVRFLTMARDYAIVNYQGTLT